MSGLLLLEGHQDLLVSGGGDGTLRLWSWQIGVQLDCFFFEEKQVCLFVVCPLMKIVLFISLNFNADPNREYCSCAISNVSNFSYDCRRSKGTTSRRALSAG